MNIFEFLEDIDYQITEKVHAGIAVTAKELGLDPRACYSADLYILASDPDRLDDSYIVARANNNSLRYYGGFEYVKPEYRSVYGSFAFYSAEDDRVKECIDYYMNNKE